MASDRTPAGSATTTYEEIATNLHFLRRYARALTGNQTTGDRCAAATLQAILTDPTAYRPDLDPKVALFRAFHVIWSTTGAPIDDVSNNEMEHRAQLRLRGLTKDSREALLLHTIEGFDFDELAQVLKVSRDQAQSLVQHARSEMEEPMRGAVLIIEDEPFIAMHIESIVVRMGHHATGIARTRSEAVKLGAKERPDLILADIKLQDNSSGIEAVQDLLKTLGEVPVIFITASPELLLTGEGSEPTFMIAKPFTEEQVRSSVSQAMFFAISI